MLHIRQTDLESRELQRTVSLGVLLDLQLDSVIDCEEVVAHRYCVGQPGNSKWSVVLQDAGLCEHRQVGHLIEVMREQDCVDVACVDIDLGESVDDAAAAVDPNREPPWRARRLTGAVPLTAARFRFQG